VVDSGEGHIGKRKDHGFQKLFMDGHECIG